MKNKRLTFPEEGRHRLLFSVTAFWVVLQLLGTEGEGSCGEKKGK